MPATATAAKVETLDIPVGLVDPSPFQHRKRFDEEKLRELGQSIKKGEQHQAVKVRRVGDRFELVFGERRLRACKLVKVRTIRAVVVDMTDEEVAAAQAEENLKREDITPIETARALKSYADASGKTQKAIGGRFGMKQPTVANYLRLLELPEVFQDAIDDGALTVSQAKEVAKWKDRPVVLAEIEKELKHAKNQSGDGWKGHIFRAVGRVSRPMEKSSSGRQFPVTRAQRKELDCGTVTTWLGDTEVAFNVELWDKLHAAHMEKVEAEAVEAGDVIAADGSGAAAEKTDEQKAKEQAERVAKRVAAYRLRWHQRKAIAAVDEMKPEHATRLLLYWCGQSGAGTADRWQTLATRLGVRERSAENVLVALGKTTPKKLVDVTRDLFREWLAGDLERSNSATPEVVLAVCEWFKVRIEEQWENEAEFLELLPVAELLKLASDWGIEMVAGGEGEPEKRLSAHGKSGLVYGLSQYEAPHVPSVLLHP